MLHQTKTKKEKLEQAIEELRAKIVQLKAEEEQTIDPLRKAQYQATLTQLEQEKEEEQRALSDLKTQEEFTTVNLLKSGGIEIEIGGES